ncbi:MAG: archease [Alphaproteobacteria bacterium]|nr:archease [Alphaproteobacteria bacterium]
MASEPTSSTAEATSAEEDGWELFAHDADIGVRGFGATREAAFEGAAMALNAVLTSPGGVRPSQAIEISCEAPDDEFLLVDWLNALVYEMATRGMLFGRFKVHIEGHELHGQAWGEPIDAARHSPATEVKGATYTELRVAKLADGRWVAQCIVDV